MFQELCYRLYNYLIIFLTTLKYGYALLNNGDVLKNALLSDFVIAQTS